MKTDISGKSNGLDGLQLAFQETMLFNRLFFDVDIWHVRKPHNGTFTV